MNTWEYAESIESSSIVSIEKKYGIFYDGQFQSPNSKKYLKTISPSTEDGQNYLVPNAQNTYLNLQD